jgi:hypothetical protein
MIQRNLPRQKGFKLHPIGRRIKEFDDRSVKSSPGLMLNEALVLQALSLECGEPKPICYERI